MFARLFAFFWFLNDKELNEAVYHVWRGYQ